jgi:hypothetical protein
MRESLWSMASKTYTREISGSHERRIWSLETSEMYCRVVKQMLIDVSEVHTASIIRAIIPVSTEALKRADFYPISPSHYTSHSLLLWTALPPSAIGPLPHLLSPIPHWSAQFTWTLHNTLHNLLSFRARLTHRPEYGGSTHLWNVGQHLHDFTAVQKTVNFKTYTRLNFTQQQICFDKSSACRAVVF